MTSENLQVLAPLESFCWSGTDWELLPGVTVRRRRVLPDLGGLEKTLGEDERRILDSVTHWLEFEWTSGVDSLSASEVVNLSILSLWLAQPTKATVSIRFEIEKGGTSKSRARLLNRFQWVEGAVADQTTDTNLNLASRLLPPLLAACKTRSRLNNATVLTLSGCWAGHWQTALICYSTALEALLTYSKSHGLTRRLATTFACLTAKSKFCRDSAFIEFSAIYSARSDIIHGRMHEIVPGERLPIVARSQELVRLLWQQVLLEPSLAIALESMDSAREGHLNTLCAGYSPPRATQGWNSNNALKNRPDDGLQMNHTLSADGR